MQSVACPATHRHHTLRKLADRLSGDTQSLRGERVAQKIKPPLDLADEGLVGVLLLAQLIKRRIHGADGAAQFPAGGREHLEDEGMAGTPVLDVLASPVSSRTTSTGEKK